MVFLGANGELFRLEPGPRAGGLRTGTVDSPLKSVHAAASPHPSRSALCRNKKDDRQPFRCKAEPCHPFPRSYVHGARALCIEIGLAQIDEFSFLLVQETY